MPVCSDVAFEHYVTKNRRDIQQTFVDVLRIERAREPAEASQCVPLVRMDHYSMLYEPWREQLPR